MLLCGSRCSALARLERDQWLRRASEHPSHMLRGKWDRNILSLRKGKAEPPLPWAPPTSCSGCPEREEEEPLSPGTSPLAGNGGKSTAFPQTESLHWLFPLIFSPFDISAYKHRQPETSSFPSAPLDLQGMPAEQRFFPPRKCSAEQLRCRRGLQNIPLPLPEASCCERGLWLRGWSGASQRRPAGVLRALHLPARGQVWWPSFTSQSLE